MNRVPTPAAVKALLVAALGVTAVAVGHELDPSWIDLAVGVYASVIPAIAYLVRSPLDKDA